MGDHPFDTLEDFHMHNPEHAVYALMANIIAELETNKQQNINGAWDKVYKLLDTTNATAMLRAMCLINQVDYLQVLQDAQNVTSKHIAPQLLVLLALFPVPYVATKLDIDNYWAEKILEQFHKHFTIDDPINWLKSFLNATEQSRNRYDQALHDLRLGKTGAMVGTPVDTHEYRRHERDLRPRPFGEKEV